MTYDRIGSYSDVVSLGISTDAGSAYAAGDLIGGKLTLNVDRFFQQAAGRFGTEGNAIRTGMIRNLTLLDMHQLREGYTLFLFDADPSSTVFTENVRFNPTSNDFRNILGSIRIHSGQYCNVQSKAVAHIGNVGQIFRTRSGQNLFAALVARDGSRTYAGSAGLTLRLGIEQH